jgi:hypothetical protein
MKLPRPRFRLRTLLGFVTLAAMVAAYGPKLYRRYVADRAVRLTLEGGSNVNFWSLAPEADSPKEQAAWLADDADRIVERLLRRIEAGPRDLNSRRLLHEIVDRAHSAPLRAKAAKRLLAVVGRDPESTASDDLLLLLLARWLPSPGIEPAFYNEIVAKAKARGPNLSPAWAKLLVALGSRNAIELLLQSGGTHDGQLAEGIHNSALTWSSWPGLLPHVRRWLEDPKLAPLVIRYHVLYSTDDCRNVLLGLATNPAQQAQLRKWAIETLELTLPGRELLLEACREPAQRTLLEEVLDEQFEDSIHAAQRRAAQINGDDLLQELIDELAGTSWLLASGSGPPRTPAELAAARDSMKKDSQRILVALSGRDDLKKPEEWQAWLDAAHPPAVSYQRLLSLVIAEPDLLKHHSMSRRAFLYEPGSMPDDCLPLYLQMLHNGPWESQYCAAYALLWHSDNLDAVPVLIDRISQAPSGDDAFEVYPAIQLLQQRFAVNYFWDAAAWKEWWQQYQADGGEESLNEHRDE